MFLPTEAHSPRGTHRAWKIAKTTRKVRRTAMRIDAYTHFFPKKFFDKLDGSCRRL